MKQKSTTKLVLKKSTITTLSNNTMANIKGGDLNSVVNTCAFTCIKQSRVCIVSLRPGCIDTWDAACTQ
jgi:hypothetical protein